MVALCGSPASCPMVRQLAGTPGKLRQTVDEASEVIIWVFRETLREKHRKVQR